MYQLMFALRTCWMVEAMLAIGPRSAANVDLLGASTTRGQGHARTSLEVAMALCAALLRSWLDAEVARIMGRAGTRVSAG